MISWDGVPLVWKSLPDLASVLFAHYCILANTILCERMLLCFVCLICSCLIFWLNSRFRADNITPLKAWSLLELVQGTFMSYFSVIPVAVHVSSRASRNMSLYKLQTPLLDAGCTHRHVPLSI